MSNPDYSTTGRIRAMTPRFLARLVVANGRVEREEKLLLEKKWRVRVVQTGPDGFLYLGVQRADGTGGVIAPTNRLLRHCGNAEPV